ncbi:MAG: efflux RND transporter permease subunit [Myxococcota bacterium]
MVERLEGLVFRHRPVILVVLALFTAVRCYYAAQLRMDAGVAKQLPTDHPYVETFLQYQDQYAGTNRLIVVLRARDGDIWDQPFLARLHAVTDAVFFLPGVDRRTVQSIWTPNTFYFEVTEEGMTAANIVPSDVLPDRMSEEDIARIRQNTILGNLVGRLVANDSAAAMVTAELVDVDPATGEKLDYIGLSVLLDEEIRDRFADDDFDVHILGFTKLIGDIAEGAKSVAAFFLLAFVLTAAAVYRYSRSWILTALPLLCSLVSVVWQFAVIHLLGFGLDPLAILVPFLVFAIGVSHGVQQINLISKEVCAGATAMEAARRSFSGLLVPGTMALVTDLIGFGTLILIPIPMIQELGITACVGVAFKIVTNLFLLPILVSYFRFDGGYVARQSRAREGRDRIVSQMGRIAEPRYAYRTVAVFTVIFALAVWFGEGRHVGDLHPGSPELHQHSRYNVDVRNVVERFSSGLDVLTVIPEAGPEGCIDFDVMDHLASFSWRMKNVTGVLGVASLPLVARQSNAGWTEGNLRWVDLPRNPYSLVRVAGLVSEETGLVNKDCSVMPVYVFMEDHKAESIDRVVAAVESFRGEQPFDGVRLRLASGNVGVMAAVNHVLAKTERRMMVYVYLAIIALVYLTYRDWRATVCCSLPLVVATFLGYWFMKTLGIGIKVATMPVMVLAVGLGVDYAFYIYNRLQYHLWTGLDVTASYKKALSETGIAVIFTAVTMAIGVVTWAFSALKFQADMGLLLAFMFLINMVMAVTLLPSLAVVIDRWIPRRRPVRPPAVRH